MLYELSIVQPLNSEHRLVISCVWFSRSIMLFRQNASESLNQGLPTFVWPWSCTPSTFWQMNMYSFSISKEICMFPFSIMTDDHVLLKFVMTKHVIMINYRHI